MNQKSFFDDSEVPMNLLRQRAYNLRWAMQPADVIVLTAADPDFPVAPAIREALQDYISGGIFSYGPAEGLPEFRQACAKVTTQRKGYACTAHQILAVDSAAAGMMHIARLTIQPGDEAIVFDPVDFLFKASVEAAGGRVKLLPVDPDTGIFDFEKLPELLTPRTKLLGVCNPINPVGRILTREELELLGNFAVENNLWILNDEIWSDIIFSGQTFISLPSISSEIAARTFTVHGFSKTFGLAGLRVGFVICPTPEAFESLTVVSAARTTMTGVSTLSQVAATAAYEHGWDWAEQFVRHLESLRDLGVQKFSQLEGVSVLAPQGTYVLFPNFTAWNLPMEQVCDTLLKKYKVATVPGAARWFGPGAEGHLRVVFSTSREIFEEGLNRVIHGLTEIRKSTC